MKTRLTKIGSGLALVFERGLLRTTGITAETPLEVSTDGDIIVVTPERGAARATKLRMAMHELDDRYAGVFRRLAK